MKQLPTNDPLNTWLSRRYPQQSFTSPSEVDANKRGNITRSQRASLNLKLAQESLAALIFVLIGLGLPTYIGVALLITTSPQAMATAYVWVFILLIGAWLFGLIGIVRGVRTWLEFFSARREIAEGKIAQTEGKVIWVDDIYTAVIGPRKLKPIYNKLNLLPAHYRFYHLNQSRWLLSAEQLPTSAKRSTVNMESDANPQSEMLRVLSKTNHFRLDELEANQAGQMTARQKLRLVRKGIVRFATAAILSPLVALIIFNGLLTSPVDFLTKAFVETVIFGFFSSIFGGLAILLDLLGERVAKIEAIGQRQKIGRGRYIQYKYLFENLRFDVSGQAYNALIIGLAYRVYYAPHSKMLLSLEPLNVQNESSI